jgi:hypothetical protein
MDQMQKCHIRAHDSVPTGRTETILHYSESSAPQSSSIKLILKQNYVYLIVPHAASACALPMGQNLILQICSFYLHFLLFIQVVIGNLRVYNSSLNNNN